jgi:vacuolar-type H+-ATPase subunit H
VNDEIAQILDAESSARRIVEQARREAHRIDEDARRRAAELVERAHAGARDRRERVRAERIASADEEVRRIREEGDAEAEALKANAARHLEAATEAAFAALVAELA